MLQLESARKIRVGRLGSFDCPRGFYVYVGSAFGPGGLAARLRRHLRPVKRLHWHIDYLRRCSACDQIWFSLSEQRLEHPWAAVLAGLPDALMPIPKFGATDCSCAAHLYFFRRRPRLGEFAAALAAKTH